MLLLKPMDASEILSTIAQLALGLIGFSGVVIALDQDHTEVSRVDAYRLYVLIFSGSGAMFLALFPLGLGFLGLPEIDIWKISNLVHSLFAWLFIGWFVPASYSTGKIAPEIFHASSMAVYVGGYLLNAVLQGRAAMGALQEQAVGIYIFGLIWLLFVSLLRFRRMLLIHQNKHSGD